MKFLTLFLFLSFLLIGCNPPSSTGVSGDTSTVASASGGQVDAADNRLGVLSPREFVFSTIQFICLAIIVYFLLVVHPKRNREESQTKFIENLKKNDQVMTSSGVYGQVVSKKPEAITVEIASNVRVRVDPQHIYAANKGSSTTGSESNSGKK